MTFNFLKFSIRSGLTILSVFLGVLYSSESVTVSIGFTIYACIILVVGAYFGWLSTTVRNIYDR